MTLLEFPDAAAWEAWLAGHHADATEAWLRIAKRGSDLETLAIADALDVALCWGWIDGQRKGLDDRSFQQRYCPRRPRSSWSQINVAKVEALTAAGRMRPPGSPRSPRRRPTADGPPRTRPSGQPRCHLIWPPRWPQTPMPPPRSRASADPTATR